MMNLNVHVSLFDNSSQVSWILGDALTFQHYILQAQYQIGMQKAVNCLFKREHKEPPSLTDEHQPGCSATQVIKAAARAITKIVR
jgi:hypothetical protein